MPFGIADRRGLALRNLIALIRIRGAAIATGAGVSAVIEYRTVGLTGLSGRRTCIGSLQDSGAGSSAADTRYLSAVISGTRYLRGAGTADITDIIDIEERCVE